MLTLWNFLGPTYLQALQVTDPVEFSRTHLFAGVAGENFRRGIF